MKSLGLVGGTSWYSTLEYYRYINSSINSIHGNETNPPLVVYTLNQSEIHAFQRTGRWDSVAEVYYEASRRLEAAGCEGILFAANTAHRIFDCVQRNLHTPILHIGDAIGIALLRSGVGTVGLVGTIFTMEHDFLKVWLFDRYQIKTLIPSDPRTRVRLQELIEQELCMGIFNEDTKQFILSELATLHRSGASGIVLGCTELSLLIREPTTGLPLFDTTALHAQLGVDFILGNYIPRISRD